MLICEFSSNFVCCVFVFTCGNFNPHGWKKANNISHVKKKKLIAKITSSCDVIFFTRVKHPVCL